MAPNTSATTTNTQAFLHWRSRGRHILCICDTPMEHGMQDKKRHNYRRVKDEELIHYGLSYFEKTGSTYYRVGDIGDYHFREKDDHKRGYCRCTSSKKYGHKKPVIVEDENTRFLIRLYFNSAPGETKCRRSAIQKVITDLQPIAEAISTTARPNMEETSQPEPEAEPSDTPTPNQTLDVEQPAGQTEIYIPELDTEPVVRQPVQNVVFIESECVMSPPAHKVEVTETSEDEEQEEDRPTLSENPIPSTPPSPTSPLVSTAQPAPSLYHTPSFSEAIHDLEYATGRLSLNPWDDEESFFVSAGVEDPRFAIPETIEEESTWVGEIQTTEDSTPVEMATPEASVAPPIPSNKPVLVHVVESPRPVHEPEILQQSRPQTLIEIMPLRINKVAPKAPQTPATQVKEVTPTHDDASMSAQGIDLPDQQEFFERHVTICTRSDPPRSGASCKICRTPFLSHTSRKVIRVHACRHHFHESCLAKFFRSDSSEYGLCPTCFVPLCEFTLSNRLNADRVAIFGNSKTSISETVEVNLLKDNSSIAVQTEEQLASVYLHIVQEHISELMETEWSRTKKHGTEPKWKHVVRCATSALEDHRLSHVRCRYFPWRTAFLEFVVYAALAQSVGNTRAAMQRKEKSAAFPSLDLFKAEYHRLRDRLNSEKSTWSKARHGPQAFDVVIEDRHNLAMAALSRRS